MGQAEEALSSENSEFLGPSGLHGPSGPDGLHGGPSRPEGGPTDGTPTQAGADGAWAFSLREVMRDVIAALPDHATLGELVDAARRNRAMAPVLDIFTVQELIETATKRPRPKPNAIDHGGSHGTGEPALDADGNPVMELDAPAVIRRRADVQGGDVRVLRSLAERGPQRESELGHHAMLSPEQLRIILRHLRSKGFVHVEGSGLKRRLKITRHGSTYLRKG